MADEPAEKWIPSACAALSGPRHKVSEGAGSLPDGPGLYAIYGGPETWLQLGLGKATASAALYVGKAEESLATDRELQFLSARTGQSTVRRTFAALLRDALALRGIPRNQTKPEPAKMASYALSDEDDARLTDWLTTHLEIAVWEKPEECTALGAVEVAVLRRWSPPLNLSDPRSTAGARVSAARKAMANDARAWARERGHRF